MRAPASRLHTNNAASPWFSFLLVNAHLILHRKKYKGGIMANAVNHVPEEVPMEKVVWGYVGAAVLWIALLLTGIALERLGLTSGILSGVLPGEVGTLRSQVTDVSRDLGAVKLERDNLKQTEGALRAEISKLRGQLSAAPSAPAPTSATP